jgi:hypothetical protein
MKLRNQLYSHASSRQLSTAAFPNYLLVQWTKMWFLFLQVAIVVQFRLSVLSVAAASRCRRLIGCLYTTSESKQPAPVNALQFHT